MHFQCKFPSLHPIIFLQRTRSENNRFSERVCEKSLSESLTVIPEFTLQSTSVWRHGDCNTLYFCKPGGLVGKSTDDPACTEEHEKCVVNAEDGFVSCECETGYARKNGACVGCKCYVDPVFHRLLRWRTERLFCIFLK